MQVTTGSTTFGHRAHSGAPAHPRAPLELEQTGLTAALLTSLLARHLLLAGDLTLAALSARLALHPHIVNELIKIMLDADQIYARSGVDGQIEIGLHARGRSYASAACAFDGYTGPAPVSAGHYRSLVDTHALAHRAITQAEVHAAFAGTVIDDAILDQLGRALNSPDPILIYGPSGAGKTFLCHRLADVVRGQVLIPHAVAVGDRCVALFDPALHERIDASRECAGPAGADPRLVLCQRPALICGSAETGTLEAALDSGMGCAQAPVQLRANNGLLVIDDFDRQPGLQARTTRRCHPRLASHQDWLRVGAHSALVTVDVKLVLVTNSRIDHVGLVGFGGWIGHKIHIGAISADDYLRLWQQSCENLGLSFDHDLAHYALEQLHGPNGVPLLPSHPWQLLSHMLGQARYADIEPALTTNMLHDAWSAQIGADQGDGFAASSSRTHITH